MRIKRSACVPNAASALTTTSRPAGPRSLAIRTHLSLAGRYRPPSSSSHLASLLMARVQPTASSSNTRLSRPHPTTAQRARTYSQSQSRRSSVYRTSLHGSSATASLHLSWLVRTSIPPRRGMVLPNDVQKRHFFGLGEIIGVLANPAETLRALTESRKMLEDAKRELAEARERAQLSPTHTFSPLPNFYKRPAEIKAIESALQGDPCFTILFGASSVGKTALLRQVLSSNKFHVLHFDLRIAGFADLASLYMSLSQQMEAFFMAISQDPGYEDFEKQAWGFKHDRLNVERRLAANSQESPGISPLSDIKTSDVARLMELFQSSLLRYRVFEPSKQPRKDKTDADASSQRSQTQPNKRASKMRFSWLKPKSKRDSSQPLLQTGVEQEKPNGEAKTQDQAAKRMPVFLIDEAHKLPALIRSTDAMKCLLDAMLVITKQDRLCHVIHATSDPFYQTWLRQLNVMQHCKIITIGDYPKYDIRRYFREAILPSVPEQYRPGLDFERLYEAFGGKLAHWQDFVTDYVNSGGKLDVKQGSHFLQAHALLNLHVIHSAQAPPPDEEDGPTSPRSPQHMQATTPQNPVPPGMQRAASHQPLSTGTGFRIYSPLTLNADPHVSSGGFNPAGTGSDTAAEFTAIQLLKVMDRLVQPGVRALSYFHLCREFGARAIDAMVRGRILDLRWTDTVSREGIDPRVLSMRVRESLHLNRTPGHDSLHVNRLPGAGSSGTMVNEIPEDEDPDADITALTDEEYLQEERRVMALRNLEVEDEEIVGPKVLPITPIMRFAMREVVQEYYEDDDGTASEFHSLSDVEEY